MRGSRVQVYLDNTQKNIWRICSRLQYVLKEATGYDMHCKKLNKHCRPPPNWNTRLKSPLPCMAAFCSVTMSNRWLVVLMGGSWYMGERAVCVSCWHWRVIISYVRRIYSHAVDTEQMLRPCQINLILYFVDGTNRPCVLHNRTRGRSFVAHF